MELTKNPGRVHISLPLPFKAGTIQIMVKKESVKLPGLLFLGILLLFKPAWGSQVADAAPYFSAIKSFSHNGDAYEAEFRNGMRVVIEESFGIPLAAITALIAPIAGQSGDVQISKAAEFYREKVEPEIFALGGMVSAGTARNFINIKIVVPAVEIRRVLEILGGLESVKPPETSPLSTVDSFNLEEINSDLDQAKIMQLTLKSVARGREEPDNGNITFSTAGRVVSGLTIAGSVQHEKVLNYISEFFPKKRTSSLLPLQGQNSAFDIDSLNSSIDYAYFRSELDFPIFTVTYQIPPEGHPQRLQVEVLREIIGGGLASLLRVDEEGYSLNFQHRADIVSTESGSYLVVTAAVHPDYLDRVEILVLAGISLLGKTEMPGALITRAKALYLLNFYREMESLPSRADSWADKILRGEVRNRNHLIEMLKGLDSKSLKNAGTSYLDTSRAFVREYIPAGFSRSFNSETYSETVQILLPQSLFAAEKRLEKLTYTAPEISFSVPVHVSEAVSPELKKSSILRGPDIYIYEKHNSPLVTAGIYYVGGFPAEGKTNAGMTEILLSSMLQTWSNNGLDNQMISLEGRGCVLEAVVKPDYFGFRATVLSSNFETVFSELMGMINSFSVEDDMVAKYRNNVKFTSFLRNPGIPVETPSTTIPLDSGLIYQAEPGGTGLSDKPSTLSSWYGMISENHPAIVIYGDVKGTSFLRKMVTDLSNSSRRKYTASPGKNRDAARIKPIVIPGSVTGSCTFVTPGLPVSSGLGESLRLISRAQDGSGINIKWITLAKKGYGIISMAASPGEAGKDCKPEIILPELGKKKFSNREFNQAKVRAITSYHLETENPSLMLNSIVISVLSGEQGDFIRQHLVDLKRLRIVEAESVLETLFGE